MRLASCLSFCLSLALAAAARGGDAFKLSVPQGLAAQSAMPLPKGAKISQDAVELGKLLFFDPRLSTDNSVSCATCHDPQKGWSNGERFATGINQLVGGRSAPTIINAAYQRFQFWDGRAEHLEGQALGPIQNPIEMNMQMAVLKPKLQEIAGYREAFQRTFGDEEVTDERIAAALAAFERTVLSGGAPYDQFKAGDQSALSESAQRGLKLFFGKANCGSCHTGPNFTDGGFHNIGVGMDQPKPDIGRQEFSKLLGDRGAFKTPTLREIARTAPYMHDGSLATLEDVVEFYNKGGIANPQLDEELFPIKLSAEQKQDLITFMKEGLSSPNYPLVEAPELPE